MLVVTIVTSNHQVFAGMRKSDSELDLDLSFATGQ